MKFCDAPVYINSRISLCSWFCVFVDHVAFMLCTLGSRYLQALHKWSHELHYIRFTQIPISCGYGKNRPRRWK